MNSKFLTAFRDLWNTVAPLTSSLYWLETTKEFNDNFTEKRLRYDLFYLKKYLDLIVFYLWYFNDLRKQLDSATSLHTERYAQSLTIEHKILLRKLNILKDLEEVRELRRK